MIDWSLIAKAVQWYESAGFEYVEVPWIVPDHICDTTFTGMSHQLTSGEKLVGSAEQSFLQLAKMQLLNPHEDYVAISPCFRYEDSYNALKRRWFMKVELFCFSQDASVNLLEEAEFFREQALGFFEGLTCGDVGLVTVHTDIGKDIYLNEVEVGSYGTREYTFPKGDFFQWAYGTGLAEPRFSAAKGMHWT